MTPESYVYFHHTKYVEGYIVFAFLFVCMFVPSFLGLSVMFVELESKFLCQSLYKTLHDKDPLLDFILFGMMVDIGLKFSSVIPTLGPDQVKIFALSLYSYIIKTFQ